MRVLASVAFLGATASVMGFQPAMMPRARRAKLSMSIEPVAEDIRSVALPFAAKPKNLNGELVGDFGFDPFKFTDNGDLAKLRSAELKHGRVCMLAVVGILTQEVWQWNDSFPSKNFLEALKTAPTLGLAQILAAIAAFEISTSSYEGRVPGDLGFDPLKLSADGIRENWALSELKHGRLAMIATLAFFVQALVSDKPILEQTFDWAKSFA